MAKTDLVQNLQADYSQPISARGKTAIVMDDITENDISDLKFKISGGNLNE